MRMYEAHKDSWNMTIMFPRIGYLEQQINLNELKNLHDKLN